METISTKAFGAYDLRGIYPGEINEEMAEKRRLELRACVWLSN